MLDDSMLDMKFWENAFLTAVYVRNKVWSQGSQSIPYWAVFGNFVIYLIFEFLVVKCSLTLTKVNNANRVINHLKGYLLNMPLIAMLISFSTRTLGVSLELIVLYSMTNENLSDKVS
jgi:hypothetical protein